MAIVTLSDSQLALVERPLIGRLFLQGPAGGGKTTAALARLLHLLRSGVAARSVLVIVPQRTLAAPYLEALRRPTVDAGGEVTVSTVGGLAQRLVDLFWPLVAGSAGFAHPDQPPVFLTLETAQYYMAHLARPLFEQGYFESIVIDRNRLYSQILDNLNKAAVVGFPVAEIGERLKAAWGGEQSQHRVYDEAQECADRFRRYCLAHNLLDFSLQIEVFANHLWTLPLCRDYLLQSYTHLLVDNVEEDTPVAHDLLRDWLPHCRSALLVCDEDAGYRRFLGADPQGAAALGALCDERWAWSDSFVASPGLHALSQQLSRSLKRSRPLPEPELRGVLSFAYHRYHPQMLDWVASEIAGLVHEQGLPPGEIVVLAPFLSDSLRFSLSNRLEQRGVPARSHRPSRALREEPATHCLLTLATVAHPQWGICPLRYDVAGALVQAIDGMDPLRAQLLAQTVYRLHDGAPTLASFDQLVPEMQQRVTFLLGERYERLRAWLAPVTAEEDQEPLDHFLARLFGELLSQDGFGFHRHYDAGQVAANLIESARKFRWVAGAVTPSVGREYVAMVGDGVVAAQYVRDWRLRPVDAVLLAPAYTFLMNNRPVDVQFWLDVGSSGWWERLYQPLTQPYVLSRRWPRGALWTDNDEHETRQDALDRLTLGLLRRCRQRVYLGLSELSEQGSEQKGPLLQAIQRVLRVNWTDDEGRTTNDG